jgi:streptomycin 6-kinase
MVARYGGDVESWLDELPPVLAQLAERWQIELGSLIPRGHMSVVIRCRTADRNPAVLKVCYDRARLATEAAALQGWNTRHVPSVLAVDTTIGALLMEAIVPGTMLLESLTFPVLDVATLLTSLHETGSVDRSYPLLERRVAYLFDAWARHLTRQPELRQVVSPDLFERGRRLASRLAEQRTPMVLLHGDLTAVNVLYGGEQRGLVAIDPAPCLGDPAFDAIDLVVGPGLPADLWCTDDVAVISARAASVAHMIGVDARTYRHFPTNEDLETAAWISITQHFTHVDSTPKNVDHLVDSVRNCLGSLALLLELGRVAGRRRDRTGHPIAH